MKNYKQKLRDKAIREKAMHTMDEIALNSNRDWKAERAQIIGKRKPYHLRKDDENERKY